MNVGDEVYYTWEDYDTGELSIYKSKIVSIETHEIQLKDKILKPTFYQLESGIGCQKNACYTIDELFKMKQRLESILKTTDKEKLIKEEE